MAQLTVHCYCNAWYVVPCFAQARTGANLDDRLNINCVLTWVLNTSVKGCSHIINFSVISNLGCVKLLT